MKVNKIISYLHIKKIYSVRQCKHVEVVSEGCPVLCDAQTSRHQQILAPPLIHRVLEFPEKPAGNQDLWS